ncbi:uncharacterized protein LOC118438312 [Folsomia candida]|uniref:uncharacterized protein LOC118438312 n=1 Tax=Folsomia candida TaxID=158441 RepID=UPI001605265A|nr:uncharacterized protein LOC118438312 [Folsomia candida]
MNDILKENISEDESKEHVQAGDVALVEISFLEFNPLFDVKQIILNSDEEKGTVKGRRTLAKISESNSITYDIKTLVKHRIVSYLVKHYTYYPHQDIKKNLAQCVAAQLFLNLQLRDIANLFYRESRVIVAKNTTEKITAAGLIEDRLKHLRRKHGISKSGKSKIEDCSEAEGASEDEYEKKSWLSYSSTPLDQVADYMSQTYRLRSKELSISTNLSVTLSEWPRLLDTPGMIDQDFYIRHPGKSEIMLHKWGLISNQIWKYASTININSAGEIGISINLVEWSNDQIKSGSLILLPYLLSRSAYSKTNKKRRKITGGQSSDFFLQFVNSNEDLEEFRLSESARKQPFVVCVGTLKNIDIQQSYVMVERRLIPAESLVKAVDICFKIFYVLQLKFPNECSSVWAFFDHSVFQINEIKSPSSSVLSLSSQIN